MASPAFNHHLRNFVRDTERRQHVGPDHVLHVFICKIQDRRVFQDPRIAHQDFNLRRLGNEPGDKISVIKIAGYGPDPVSAVLPQQRIERFLATSGSNDLRTVFDQGGNGCLADAGACTSD